MDVLTKAPRALESFTLRVTGPVDSRQEDVDALISGLSEHQADFLHTIMFYGPHMYFDIHGYRCSMYRNEELNNARISDCGDGNFGCRAGLLLRKE